MYCVYRNSGWYIHGGPLFGGSALLGGSVIGGSIVYLLMTWVTLYVTVYTKTRHFVRKIFFGFLRSTAKFTFLTLS